MARMTITDLPVEHTLGHAALASIRGAGAGWVYGWIRPFVAAAPSVGAAVNLYQFNNFGGQMNNQIQIIEIQNAAASASITVTPEQQAFNNNH